MFSMDQKDNDCKKIKIDSLIALCEIENYNEFCQELELLIKSNKNKDLIYKMYDIMQGKFKVGFKKYKKFVKKYQNVIDIMKKYECLGDMTIVRYNPDGKPNEDSTENYFYEYICKHKKDIEAIKSVALKIKKLGFYEITFGKNLDFTNIEYKLDENYGSNFEFLENMEVIPSYNYNPIKYKTTGSCYCLTIKTIGYCDSKDITDYYRRIELNSLVFDPDRLPNEITKKSTLEVIRKIATETNKDYEIIRDSINMSISIDDLINQYNNTKRIIESIKSIEDKHELNQILNNILSEITKLKSESLILENEMIDNSQKIDENNIENEKKLYLEGRKWYDII